MEPLTRITAATVDVLDALLGHPEGCWGLLAIKRSGRPAGTVYPVLDRLERAGWVVSNWEDDAERPGPRRRYYRLTAGGASRAVQTVAEFRARSSAPAPVLSPAPRPRFSS